jgi:hypothetical protein
VEGSCERSNESSSSIKCWEILEQLLKWRLLKMDSAPWSYGMKRRDMYHAGGY